METGNGVLFAGAGRDKEMGINGLMVIEFQFGKMKLVLVMVVQ
jgi:hypothetical protein